MSDYPLTSTWAEVDAAAQAVKNGIPKANLSGAVQASLDKADSALQPTTGLTIANQAEKTPSMTTPIGVDSNGKLWVDTLMTLDAKDALLNLLAHVAYIDTNGQEYLDRLEQALTAKLLYIVADYVQDRTIYDADSLDILREGDDLIVTAYYDDGSHYDVDGYTLSGTLTVGTSTITVAYGGKTATFDVVVSERYEYTLSSGLLKKNIGALGHDTTHGMYIGANNSNRRNFLLDYGEHPMIITTNGSTYGESTLYPIPVPTNATKVTVSITPNTQYPVIQAARWNGTIWEYLGETGWQLGSYTYTLPAGTTHIGIASKYNSSGNSYPTEPSELTVVFADE